MFVLRQGSNPRITYFMHRNNLFSILLENFFISGDCCISFKYLRLGRRTQEGRKIGRQPKHDQHKFFLCWSHGRAAIHIVSRPQDWLFSNLKLAIRLVFRHLFILFDAFSLITMFHSSKGMSFNINRMIFYDWNI